jgi:hypothetical protein
MPGHPGNGNDLLTMGLAHRAAEDREILGVEKNYPAVNFTIARDDPIAPGPILLHTKVSTLVLAQQADLDKRSGVQEIFDPLSRRKLASGMLFINSLLPAPGPGSFFHLPQLFYLSFNNGHRSTPVLFPF